MIDFTIQLLCLSCKQAMHKTSHYAPKHLSHEFLFCARFYVHMDIFVCSCENYNEFGYTYDICVSLSVLLFLLWSTKNYGNYLQMNSGIHFDYIVQPIEEVILTKGYNLANNPFSGGSTILCFVCDALWEFISILTQQVCVFSQYCGYRSKYDRLIN